MGYYAIKVKINVVHKKHSKGRKNVMKKLHLLLSILVVLSLCSIAYALPMNVANLYGTATANSQYGAYGPDRAIDGSFALEDHWNASRHGSVSNPLWLTIDLGTAYNVNSIDLFWGGLDGHWAGYTNNYSLYYGDDNINWTLVGSGVFIDEDPTHISSTFSFGSAGQSMQYVKYEVNGGSHWGAINEISVFADDGSGSGSGNAPVPEPATMLLFGTGLTGLIFAKKKKKKN